MAFAQSPQAGGKFASSEVLPFLDIAIHAFGPLGSTDKVNRSRAAQADRLFGIYVRERGKLWTTHNRSAWVKHFVLVEKIEKSLKALAKKHGLMAEYRKIHTYT